MDANERTTSGEAVKKTIRRNTGQGWTKPKIAGTWGLPVVAVLGTCVAPFFLLHMAGDANGHGNRDAAAFWEDWSLGLVVLGPSLFATSVLAMASQQPKLVRRFIRAAIVVAFALIYWLQLSISSKIHTSIMLGMIGVLYTVFADEFTPDSSGKAKIDLEPTEDDDSTETVAMPEKPVVAAVPASLKPGSETSKVGISLTPVVLLIVPVVAIVLDLRDLAVRNWRGASRKSR